MAATTDEMLRALVEYTAAKIAYEKANETYLRSGGLPDQMTASRHEHMRLAGHRLLAAEQVLERLAAANTKHEE